MQLQISPITLIIVLAYVSGLAFQIGRIYEQLRQAKRKAAEQSVHPTRGSVAQKEPLPTEHPIKIARG